MEQRVTTEIKDANELLKEEKDKEMIKLIEEDLERLHTEETEVIEEANQISLPSNLYAMRIPVNQGGQEELHD